MRSKITGVIKPFVIHTIFRPYYALRTSWPVWFYILNSRGRKLHRKYPLNSNEAVQRVSSDLKNKGIAVSHLDELFPGENMLEKLREYANELSKDAQVRGNKNFLMRLEGIGDGDFLKTESPLFQLAMRKPVLSVVNSYLQMFSKFFFYSLEVTVPVSEGSTRIKSQKWHRDPEDKKICKMFVYLNDVDEGAGPFTYIPESHHGGRWRYVFPPHPPRGYYPPDNAVEEAIPQEQMKLCTGKAGTMIFCDTSGLHRGGYATKNERLMLTVGYASQALFIPIPYQHPEGFSQRLINYDADARFALDKNFSFVVKVANAISNFSIKRGLYILD